MDQPKLHTYRVSGFPHNVSASQAFAEIERLTHLKFGYFKFDANPAAKQEQDRHAYVKITASQFDGGLDKLECQHLFGYERPCELTLMMDRGVDVKPVVNVKLWFDSGEIRRFTLRSSAKMGSRLAKLDLFRQLQDLVKVIKSQAGDKSNKVSDKFYLTYKDKDGDKITMTTADEFDSLIRHSQPDGRDTYEGGYEVKIIVKDQPEIAKPAPATTAVTAISEPEKVTIAEWPPKTVGFGHGSSTSDSGVDCTNVSRPRGIPRICLLMNKSDVEKYGVYMGDATTSPLLKKFSFTDPRGLHQEMRFDWNTVLLNSNVFCFCAEGRTYMSSIKFLQYCSTKHLPAIDCQKCGKTGDGAWQVLL